MWDQSSSTSSTSPILMPHRRSLCRGEGAKQGEEEEEEEEGKGKGEEEGKRRPSLRML